MAAGGVKMAGPRSLLRTGGVPETPVSLYVRLALRPCGSLWQMLPSLLRPLQAPRLHLCLRFVLSVRRTCSLLLRAVRPGTGEMSPSWFGPNLTQQKAQLQGNGGKWWLLLQSSGPRAPSAVPPVGTGQETSKHQPTLLRAGERLTSISSGCFGDRTSCASKHRVMVNVSYVQVFLKLYNAKAIWTNCLENSKRPYLI